MKIKTRFGIKGKISGYTIYKLNGETVMRSLPTKRLLPSQEFLRRQEQMSSCGILWQATKAAGLEDCWRKTKKPAGYNLYSWFVKHNINAFDENGYIAAYPLIRLTTGNIGIPYYTTFLREDRNRITLTWEETSFHSKRQEDDELCLALMDMRTDCFDIQVIRMEDAERKCLTATFILPESRLGSFRLFCFFRSKNGEYSPSVYVGEVTEY